MKFYLTLPNEPLSPSQAWACLLINLLGVPGLGSIMVRRRVGYVQAVIVVAGAILTAVGVVELLGEIIGRQQVPENWPQYLWWSGGGLGAFILGWVWSAWDSLQMLRQAKRDALKPPLR